MAEVQCPHCGGANLYDAAFCEACGKALPTGHGPRIVKDSELATTSAGRSVQQLELAKTMKKAFGALLAVAIIQVIATVLISFAGNDPRVDKKALQTVLIVMGGIGAGFFVLAIWARSSPLPAAVVGLVVYVSLHLISGILDPTTLYQGLLIKIIVVAVLIQAIQAGIQHRKLVQEMGD
ncbi:MAG: zinc ribbon domain-containing protein [Phycisphaeraceae bacterium]